MRNDKEKVQKEKKHTRDILMGEENRSGWWKDFRLGIYLLRYGMSGKVFIVMSVLFVGLGILYSFMPVMFWLNSLYFMIPTSFFVQQLQGINISDLVCSSDLSRRIKLRVINAVQLVLQTILYAVQLVILVIVGRITVFGVPQSIVRYNSLVTTGLLGLILMIYYGFAYKYFVISTVIFLFLGLGSYDFIIHILPDEKLWLPVPAEIGLGYVLILLGVGINYGISKGIYRKEFSMLAFRTMLARAGK